MHYRTLILLTALVCAAASIVSAQSLGHAYFHTTEEDVAAKTEAPEYEIGPYKGWGSSSGWRVSGGVGLGVGSLSGTFGVADGGDRGSDIDLDDDLNVELGFGTLASMRIEWAWFGFGFDFGYFYHTSESASEPIRAFGIDFDPNADSSATFEMTYFNIRAYFRVLSADPENGDHVSIAIGWQPGGSREIAIDLEGRELGSGTQYDRSGSESVGTSGLGLELGYHHSVDLHVMAELWGTAGDFYGSTMGTVDLKVTTIWRHNERLHFAAQVGVSATSIDDETGDVFEDDNGVFTTRMKLRSLDFGFSFSVAYRL